jgi:hypothetical protein
MGAWDVGAEHRARRLVDRSLTVEDGVVTY